MASAARATWPGCLRTAGSMCASTKRLRIRRKEPLMRRAEMEADQMPGQDSFLDVITNIVGILILLVLVVGLRSSRSVHDKPGDPLADKTCAQDQLQKAYSSALTAELNVNDLIQRVGNAHGEADFRQGEREW